MADKNYIKSYIKEIETQYWKIYSIDVNIEELKKLPVDEKWNVRLTMMKRKELWKYWDTHYLVENIYKKWDKKEKDNSENIPDNWTRDDGLPF